MRMLVRGRLLAGAWSPAAFLLALRLSDDHAWWATALAVAGILAVASVLQLISARGSTNAQPYELTVVEDESAQVAGYLLTFVFPFVFLDVSDWRDAVAWATFAVLTAALVLTTDLVLVSPILLLAGYHLYKIESASGFTGIMLSSHRPRPHQVVEAVQLSAGAVKATNVRH